MESQIVSWGFSVIGIIAASAGALIAGFLTWLWWPAKAKD